MVTLTVLDGDGFMEATCGRVSLSMKMLYEKSPPEAPLPVGRVPENSPSRKFVVGLVFAWTLNELLFGSLFIVTVYLSSRRVGAGLTRLHRLSRSLQKGPVPLFTNV